ncbi:MAG TPA: alpha/beta fold hydrolase [Acetobacteraceae bacterium]|jgi:alpha-beta hydrolase superfamily lysophospholipase|nr:alpha/beta fold hydrolase [Acetobacteraceae bacterium]
MTAQSDTRPNQPADAAAGASLAGPGAGTAIPAQAAAPVWFQEYRTQKARNGQNIELVIYRKRVGAPRAGEPERPILFLVHGSSMSSLTSFDLVVPGAGEYSKMNVFARHGFDVWTMDHEGYGKSARTDGNSDIASGVEDLRAAMAVVQRETGQSRCHFMGDSSGALRAAAFAMVEPDHVRRMVLTALTYTGKGSPTLAKRAEQVEYFKTHNRRLRDRAMIESIFTRDRPGTTDPAVPAAVADMELVHGDTVPTGTYLDMTAHLPVIDPAKIAAPVAVVRGEHDGIASMEDLWDFFEKLPNGDKQFIVIAGAAHALSTCRQRHAFWHTAHAFLTMPVDA